MYSVILPGTLPEWKSYSKEARKAGYVPIVVSTPEGGKVFTFAAPGYEKEEAEIVRKDFSKGGVHEECSKDVIFLMVNG